MFTLLLISAFAVQALGRAATWEDMKHGNFTQFIDHNDHSRGTFQQRFYWQNVTRTGDGSPIVMIAPIEMVVTQAVGFLKGAVGTAGLLAEEMGAAAVILEHRFFGTSSPFDSLTTENLKYLTLDNVLKDISNFARNVEFPFATESGSTAIDVPWVLAGSSWSGIQTAFTASLAPGTFWAYYASSAPLQAIFDFWEYFVPVQQGMPQDCSSDVSALIDYMDDILLHGKKQEVDALKARFGLETLQHNDDFMFALSMTIGNLWQNGDWKDKEYNTQHSMVDGFALWCDSIENATAHATSSRIEAALNGYVEFWKAFGYDYGRGYAACPDDVADAECFNFHEPTAPQYADTSVDNLVGRQFQWISCNEVAWWQTGAPTGHPTLISRLLTADYFTAQCALWFPSGPNGETYGLAKSHQVIEDINAMTGGWNPPNTSRLIYVNNEFDPWREASVSSSFRPGGPMESTEHIPIKILPAGRHASDTYTGNARLNEGAKQVIDEVIAQLKAWVGEWYTQKGRKIPWEA